MTGLIIIEKELDCRSDPSGIKYSGIGGLSFAMQSGEKEFSNETAWSENVP